jgi:hypothetical protein
MRDSAHCSLLTVKVVATTGCPTALDHEQSSEASLFCAATLHRYGLPHDYARLENHTLPETCLCCHAPLWDPGLDASRADRIFAWRSHLGSCGGDGRHHQAREAVKLDMTHMILSCPCPPDVHSPKIMTSFNPLTFVNTSHALGTSML